MTNVVVTGAAGRMGIQIVRMVKEAAGLKLSGAVERPGYPTGQDAGLIASVGRVGVDIVDVLGRAIAGAHVVIDFTSFEASVIHAGTCAEKGVALVIGSTGFTAEAKAKIAAAAKKIPIVLSPNMSVGVNVMFELVRRAAAILGDDYDIELVELHHKLKKDAPSGTAMRLAEVAAEARGLDPAKELNYGRHGMVGERPAREIGVQTVRGGDIVGEHTVFYCGQGERLEITHRATSRDQFARGAVRAAQWIAGKPPGLYDMADVLGLRGG